MIEFLQPLVDSVSRAVPAMAAKKERDEAARLGAELFLVYVQFNEALVLAEDIVHSLEVYVRRMGEHLRTGQDSSAMTAGDWVGHKLKQQATNLIGIRERMRDWRWHLQVLDGGAANELSFLLEYKVSAITMLAEVVDQGQVPLRTGGLLIDDGGTLRVEAAPGERQWRLSEHARALFEQMMAGTVRVDRPWDADVLDVVQQYLAVRKPRENLEAIRISLEKIRAALEANFTVSDILLRAGDPRAGRTWTSSL
jgi:hypothetical protein